MELLKSHPLRILNIGLFFLLAFSLAGCAPKVDPIVEEKKRVARPVGTLNQQEVLDLFTGQTVESITVKGGRVSNSYYDPNGEIRQIRYGEKRSGFWRVKKRGDICLKMEGGEEKCRVIVLSPKGEYSKYVVKKDGNHRRVVDYRKFIDGNPFQL